MSRPLPSMTNSPNATPFSPPAVNTPEGHPYVQAEPSDSRSPCPALNTLANHGYIPRTGKNVGFFELIGALQHVYNVSWVLALFLTFVGCLISGKITFTIGSGDSSPQPDAWFSWARRLIPTLRWSLDLGSLTIRGPKKLAHDASLVHPNHIPSHAPDKGLLRKLISFALERHPQSRAPGLSLVDIAHYHDRRECELEAPLTPFHKQVALGECGLAWAVMRRRSSMKRRKTGDSQHEDLITEDDISIWLGSERLPDDWWIDGGSRPAESIGLFEARRRAGDVAKIIEISRQP